MFTNLEFNFFSISLILSGSFAFLLAAWIMRKRRQVFNWFSIMLIASAWWAVAYGFELATSTLSQMLMWIKVEYVGIATLPSLWLIFCYSFVGRENRLNNLTFFSLIAYSALTYIMVVTNSFHSLFYKSTAVDTSGPFPLLAIEPGPYYQVHTIIFYFLVIAGYWSLIVHLRHSKPIFKSQNRLLIISTLIPLLVNFCYIFLNFRPYGHIDLSPFAFLLTSFIVAIGLMRFGLFDISPMARAKVIAELSDGVAVLDSYGRLTDYNKAFEVLLGGNSDLFGHPIQELFTNDIMLSPFPEMTEEGIEQELLYLKSGQVLELSINGLFEKSGLFTGSALLIKDVTKRVEEQRALEGKSKQLEELNSLKDRLFSIIAHDLRGPLLNLQETLRLINADALTKQERDELLKLLTTNVDQSVGLMHNLLDWAQSQQKGERLELQVFSVDSVFREALEPLSATALKKGITIVVDFPKDSRVYADRERIKIILRNLLNNALKFTANGGKIRAEGVLIEDEMQFAIRDNGMGMSEEVVAKLRTQANVKSTLGTDKEEGSGLGLMLCRDFLLQLGSRLEVESDIGFGSIFSFKLPLVPEEDGFL